MNTDYIQIFPDVPAWALVLLWILVPLVLTLKGFALYRAGKLQQSGWFVALFLLNTLGILELLYLFVFSKKHSSATAAPTAG